MWLSSHLVKLWCTEKDSVHGRCFCCTCFLGNAYIHKSKKNTKYKHLTFGPKISLEYVYCFTAGTCLRLSILPGEHLAWKKRVFAIWNETFDKIIFKFKWVTGIGYITFISLNYVNYSYAIHVNLNAVSSSIQSGPLI